MSDECSAQVLDENEAATLLYALEELKRKTRELYDSLPDSAVKENLALHVACIQSSSGQIMLHHQLESRFTGDELRVMYIAVCELRETMNSVLDSRSAEDGAREKAFLHLKAANALLRRLKAEMQRVGFELDAALASAYTN